MDLQHAREVFEHALLWGALGGAVLLALVCLFRYAAKSFADTLRRAGLTRKWMEYAFWVICLAVFVSYAGTKPSNALRSARSTATETEEDGPFPSVRSSLTDEDYEAGFALSRIGTNETWNFETPDDAIPQEEWRMLGAADVWFRHTFEDDWTFPIGTNAISALTVFPNGTLRPRTKDTSTHISPLDAPMGLAWASRWDWLDESARPSQFWHLYTPSNTLIMTWQNALLDEDKDKPVSLQVEFLANGDLDFRYDLSRLPGEAISNLTVGVMNAGVGRSFSAISNNVTSLRWARLDATLADDPDPDGDGLTTEEEVLIYHTDPYAKDSDYDGLDDNEEIELGTDPLNARSLDERYCDSVAQIIGDVDPWSYPEGSTNTVWEHVFYTGTTNQPFAYPVETDDTAILEVIVSGSGGGELIIGDLVVPLLAPSAGISLASNGDSSETEAKATNRVALARDKWYRCWRRVSEELQMEINSGSFTVGRLPDSFWRGHWGWLAFPRTTATKPCIHDLYARERTVTLETSIEDVTGTWASTDDVTAENSPPRSATLTGHFARDSETPVTYSLAHPLYLFGETNHTQTARYCPKIADEDMPFPDKDDELDGNGDEQDKKHRVCACGDDGVGACTCCINAEWCCCQSCGCACNTDRTNTIPESDAEEAAEYTNLTQKAVSDDASNILRLYRSNTNTVSLVVPDGEPAHCCLCPSHWGTNYAAVAWCSSEVKVIDGAGNDFSVTNESCDVHVIGANPSLATNDAVVAFVTNGVINKINNYTVLGLCFKPKTYGPDSMKRYNELSASFGYPLVVNTNLSSATELTIVSDVLLTNGIVRLALEGVSDDSSKDGEFEVYLSKWKDQRNREHPAELLLKTGVREERFFTHEQWRAISRRYNLNRKLPISILSSKAGPADLSIEYVNVTNDVRISDYALQRITSIPPPLLPDYNHDGAIDGFDEDEYLRSRVYQFWTNEDRTQGDYIKPDASDSDDLNTEDMEVNGTFDLMNLFAVRLNPSALRPHWGDDSVQYAIGPAESSSVNLNLTFVALAPDTAGSIQTNAIRTISGDLLSEAPLQELRSKNIDLTQSELGTSNLLLVAEAPDCWEGKLRFLVHEGTTVLFSAPLDMKLTSVRDMYRWMNVRAYSNDSSGRTTDIGEPSNFPEDNRDAKKFFFLHGANVTSSAAEKWGDQIFKRLWHAGCHVDFCNIDWRSNIGSSANYQENASNAFVVASILAPELMSTNFIGSKVIMAHSLGNMVASSMIQDYGLSVENYFMCNSSVPAEAYDADATTTTALVHTAWTEYPAEARANEWYKFFDADDDRSKLTWAGRFADVASIAYNFYSTGDHVLEMRSSSNFKLYDGYENWHQKFERFSWHRQELWKGRYGTFKRIGTTDWSGWGFATDAISADRANELRLTDAFKTNTVFNLYPASMNTNSIPRLVLDAHLTQGIPSRTSASGATSWGGTADFEERMINLQESSNAKNGMPRPNGWIERPNGIFKTWGDRWMHSDIKDMAYYYVYPFYQKIKELGVLQ